MILMPKKDTIAFNFAKSKPMLNRFIASSSISPEEFAVLQTYFENPHLYSDIANSPFFDPEFLFGIRLTAPIDNIRYFILPCDEDEELLKFPIKSKLITDNFQHESIFLDEQACVFLTPLNCEEKLKLVVTPNNQLYCKIMLLRFRFRKYQS